MNGMTKEQLEKFVYFDAEKGRFYWKQKLGPKRPAGKETGTIDAYGYRVISIFRKKWKEHRLVWLWIHNKFPDGDIDHINHDRQDNRPENLRECSRTENLKNLPSRRTNKYGVPGVGYSKDKGKYIAYIQVNNIPKFLGSYDKVEDAIRARKNANLEYGFHENHGKGLSIPDRRSKSK